MEGHLYRVKARISHKTKQKQNMGKKKVSNPNESNEKLEPDLEIEQSQKWICVIIIKININESSVLDACYMPGTFYPCTKPCKLNIFVFLLQMRK